MLHEALTPSQAKTPTEKCLSLNLREHSYKSLHLLWLGGFESSQLLISRDVRFFFDIFKNQFLVLKQHLSLQPPLLMFAALLFILRQHGWSSGVWLERFFLLVVPHYWGEERGLPYQCLLTLVSLRFCQRQLKRFKRFDTRHLFLLALDSTWSALCLRECHF